MLQSKSRLKEPGKLGTPVMFPMNRKQVLSASISAQIHNLDHDDSGCPPDVSRLLLSNLAPTPGEIAVIEQIVAQIQSSIDFVALGREPRFSFSFSKGLRLKGTQLNQHQALTTLRQSYKAVLSPVRRIPWEILCLIFELLDINDHLFNIPAVSQVCCFWREVAVSTPCLWNTIALHFTSQTSVPPISNQVSLVDSKLQRSGNAQLRVDISASESSDIQLPTFHKILDCSERWCEARIQLPNRLIQQLNRIRGRVPALHTLSVTTVSGFRCDAFQEAPLLRYVFLDGLQHTALPWNQLLTYEENDGWVTDHFAHQKMAVLKSASVLKLHLPRGLVWPTESVLCANLEILHVWFPPGAHENFLSKMHAPNIKEIKANEVFGDITPGLMTMIRYSPQPCLLQSLAFRKGSIVPGVLESLLRLTPELKELEIDLPPHADLRHFIVDPAANEAPLAPKLRVLCFHANTTYGYEDDITKIALSRCEPLSSQTFNIMGLETLSSLTLKFCDDSNRLRQLTLLERRINDVEVLETFVQWASVLQLALRSIESTKERFDEVDSIFSSLMTIPITDHYLQRTGIFFNLTWFVLSTERSKRFSRERKLRDRAVAIIKRWGQPIPEHYARRRWIPGPEGLLTYHPNGQA